MVENNKKDESPSKSNRREEDEGWRKDLRKREKINNK